MSVLALSGKQPVDDAVQVTGGCDVVAACGALSDCKKDIVLDSIKFNDGSEFSVLVLDSPDKWEEAIGMSFSREIQIDQKKLKLNLRCVPYGAYKYISENFEIPEEDEDDDASDPQAKKESIDSVILKRKVLFFEAATGKPIAGNNLAEKAAKLAERPVAVVDKIFDVINHYACAVVDDSVTEEFNAISSKEAAVMEFNDIDSIFDGTDSVSDRVFVFSRPFQNYIIKVPLKSISSERRSQIESECKIPTPPRRPGKGFDVNNPQPWAKEPHYVARVRNIKNKKMMMYLDECLTFKIPGDTIEQKQQWLGKRLVGDVLKIQLFIQREIIDASMAFNFF